jgi:hypothetical protein
MTRRDIERGCWIAGAVGVVGSAIGWIVAPTAFPHAWLAALACWIGWPLGSLALLLIHALTGGRWGWAVRPQLVAGLATLPLVVPFVIPLLFVLRALYPWTLANAHLHNAFYLNLPFFYARGIVYIAVWLALGGAVLWALRRNEPQPLLYRVAPPGLILLAVTVTFAAIDATMSLDPDFKSSVYGLVVGTEAVLFALSVAVLGASIAAPPDKRGTEDLGKLMLGLVIFWAYLDFMQILIIWQSDLPSEATYYLPRVGHGWQYVAGGVALLHFFLPFFLLLWPQVQGSRRGLGAVAASLVAAEVLRTWWLVVPASGRGFGLLDLLAMLAAFGLGAGVALRAPVHRFEAATADNHG